MKKVIIINAISMFVFLVLSSAIQYEYYQKTVKNTVNNLVRELKKENMQQRKVDLLLGSTTTQGVGTSTHAKSWSGMLYSYLLNKSGNQFYLNYGVDKYSTQDILKVSLKKTASLRAENLTPTTIIYESSSVNDFSKFTTAQSEKNIETALIDLRKRFPLAKIYVIPSNDTTVFNKNKNSEGLTYDQYVAKIDEFVKSKRWHFIDLTALSKSVYTKQGLGLKDILASDGKHLNDKGNQIYFNIIKQKIQL